MEREKNNGGIERSEEEIVNESKLIAKDLDISLEDALEIARVFVDPVESLRLQDGRLIRRKKSEELPEVTVTWGLDFTIPEDASLASLVDFMEELLEDRPVYRIRMKYYVDKSGDQKIGLE